MPQVGNKKFPYTPKGIAQAKQAMGRKQSIKRAMTAPTNLPAVNKGGMNPSAGKGADSVFSQLKPINRRVQKPKGAVGPGGYGVRPFPQGYKPSARPGIRRPKLPGIRRPY